MEGGCEKGGRPGALRRGRSDAEVFLCLVNGTFEVSSLARRPQPASPVVGVNWPVVCRPGSVPSSLPANLLGAAAQKLSNNKPPPQNHQLTPAHNDAFIHRLPKLLSEKINTNAITTNTCSLSNPKVLALLAWLTSCWT